MSMTIPRALAGQRLLVISHVRDDTGANGGAVYTASLLALLRRVFADVRIEYVYAQAPRHRRLRIATAFLRAAFSGLAAKIEYFRVGDARRRISEAIAQHAPSLVVFDHLETMLYAPLVSGEVKTLLVQHNDEVKLYAERVGNAWPRWLRGVLGLELRRLEHFQQAAYARCGNAVFLSADEAAQGAHAGVREIFTLLPSFDYAPIEVMQRDDQRVHLLFVGNMQWWPNVDALEWFIDEVLGAVPSDVVLHVVGRGSEKWSGRHPQLIAHGFIERRDDVWGMAPIFIAPVRLGAGVNIKVAEAIYNGRALIATPQALRGLALGADPAVVNCASAAQWVAWLSDGANLRTLARTEPLTHHRELFSRRRVEPRFAEYLTNLCERPGRSTR
jgi:hypothetical protein